MTYKQLVPGWFMDILRILCTAPAATGFALVQALAMMVADDERADGFLIAYVHGKISRQNAAQYGMTQFYVNRRMQALRRLPGGAWLTQCRGCAIVAKALETFVQYDDARHESVRHVISRLQPLSSNALGVLLALVRCEPPKQTKAALPISHANYYRTKTELEQMFNLKDYAPCDPPERRLKLCSNMNNFPA